MKRMRGPWFRGVLTLGLVGALGAGLLISNVGAVSERKEASKKFVKKQINKLRSQIPNQIPAVGNPIFIEEEELIRLSVKTDVAGADTAIATIGPFTFTANCELDGDNTIIGRVLIKTAQDDSAYHTDYGDEDLDFDAADPAATWFGGDMGVTSGGGVNYWSVPLGGSAVAPDGTTVEGQGQFYTNIGGSDCILQGFLLKTSA